MEKLCGKILTQEHANSSFALRMSSTLPTSNKTSSSWHDAKPPPERFSFPECPEVPQGSSFVKIVNNASKKRKYQKQLQNILPTMWGTKIMDSTQCRCCHGSACTYEPPACGGRPCPHPCCSALSRGASLWMRRPNQKYCRSCEP